MGSRRSAWRSTRDQTRHFFTRHRMPCPGAIEGHLRVGWGADGEQQSLVTLPPLKIKISEDKWSEVSFLTMRNAPQGSSVASYDGLLPTGLFRSIFVSRNGEFAVLDPNYRGPSERESRVHRCAFRRALRIAGRSILCSSNLGQIQRRLISLASECHPSFVDRANSAPLDEGSLSTSGI